MDGNLGFPRKPEEREKMLIRTQDRMSIIDMEEMTVKAHFTGNGSDGKGDYEIIAYGNHQPCSNSERLGSYPTKKRAVEVMNDICDAYQELREYEVSGMKVSQPVFVYYMMES